MSKSKKSTVDVQGTTVSIVSSGNDDYLSLTDIAKYKNPDHADDVIRNWLRNRNTIEFLGVWERLNNSDFNPVEFDGIKITVIESFPDTKKLDGVAVTKPVPYYIVCMIWILVFGNVRKAEIVIVSTTDDADRCSLNIHRRFL